jgi:hypothetical protein
MEVAASRNEGCDQDFRLSGAAGVLGKKMRMQVRSGLPIQEGCMGDGPDAMIFELDGVITFMARVHPAAWQELFDDYLRAPGRAYQCTVSAIRCGSRLLCVRRR